MAQHINGKKKSAPILSRIRVSKLLIEAISFQNMSFGINKVLNLSSKLLERILQVDSRRDEDQMSDGFLPFKDTAILFFFFFM